MGCSGHLLLLLEKKVFFFNDTATTEIYTLSLHDALPILLSHLFNQGLVSGEQFQMEPEFREILNSKLPNKYKLANIEQRPNRNEYHVVFAIVSESDEENVSIPFFSRISLKHAIARLQAIGFVVSIAKVSVNETKKILKKYAATK